MNSRIRNSLLRERTGQHAPVGYVELFFDLVFVFAVTQLSHSLIAHPTAEGLLHTFMLMAAVWWVWINTAWATNWLDVDRLPVRVVMFLLMAGGLVLSMSLPEAFGVQGLVFGLAFAFMQIFRTGFVLWVVRGEPVLKLNFQRILVWHGLGASLWIVGGLLVGEGRLAVWGLALLVESAGPALGFAIPGLGRASTADWTVEGAHLAERCALFTIIALGESILVMGATAAELDWTLDVGMALACSFVTSVAMWWIYFAASAKAASAVIGRSDDPGRIARLAYTYVHLIPVAGIIVSAVGAEWVLAHPDGHTDMKMALALVGGPALFLLGTLLFKLAVFGRASSSRLTGLLGFGVLACTALFLTPLMVSLAGAAILVMVAAWETMSLKRAP